MSPKTNPPTSCCGRVVIRTQQCEQFKTVKHWQVCLTTIRTCKPTLCAPSTCISLLIERITGVLVITAPESIWTTPLISSYEKCELPARSGLGTPPTNIVLRGSSGCEPSITKSASLKFHGRIWTWKYPTQTKWKINLCKLLKFKIAFIYNPSHSSKNLITTDSLVQFQTFKTRNAWLSWWTGNTFL